MPSKAFYSFKFFDLREFDHRRLGLQVKMPRNREATLLSDDNEFLVDLEKEPEGTGTISGHACLSIRAKNNLYDSDEDATPPPQPQERFLFPPSDSEDGNDDTDGETEKKARPAKKVAPQSKNKVSTHDVEADNDECASNAKNKKHTDRKIQHRKSQDNVQNIPEASSSKKKVTNSRADSKAHCRKDKSANEGKKACRNSDSKTTKDARPLPSFRHKALDSVESADWMPSPKAHGPGFELLGEEVRHLILSLLPRHAASDFMSARMSLTQGDDPMGVASPPASPHRDDGSDPLDRTEHGAALEPAAISEDAPSLEPLSPADLRVLRGALRSSFAFRGVVVGRVLSAGAHPKAASLTVVAVDLGGGGGVSAVCEAGHGLTAGELVAFAPVGAEIPSEELVIPTHCCGCVLRVAVLHSVCVRARPNDH
jgi:hypothetical protein